MTFLESLRVEMRPSPGRVRATVRLTVAAVVGAFLVLSFHIPHGIWVVFTVFVLGQPNAGASVTRGTERALGTLMGVFGAMVALPLIAAAEWSAIPIMALGIGAALYLSRAYNPTYPTFLAGLTFSILLSDLGPPGEVGIQILWRAGTIILGILIGTGAQLFLWPEDPQNLLREDLSGQIGQIRCTLAGLNDPLGAPGPSQDPLKASHLRRQLDLVADAETIHPSLRHIHADLIALVMEVDRLSSAVLWLERAVDRPVPSEAAAMLKAMEAECLQLEQTLAGAHTPKASASTPGPGNEPTKPGREVDSTSVPLEILYNDFPHREKAFAAAGPALLPALVEMDHTLQGVRTHLTLLLAGSDRDFPPVGTGERQPFFIPTAPGSHAEDLSYALKGGLAYSIALLLVKALDWPGISTCAITCMIVAQSTVGGSLRKAWLRICGATMGGLLGAGILFVVMPFGNNYVLFLAVLAACYGIAAWMAVGSSRISYAGLQIAYALSMYVLQVFGPSGNVAAARDRVIGIVMGIVIMAVVNMAISPSFARRHVRRHLAATLRHAAEVCRVGLYGPEGPLTSPRGLRHKLYQNLAAVSQFNDEMDSEPQPRDPDIVAERSALMTIAADVRGILPGLFTLARHWLNFDLREALGEAEMARLVNLALAVAGTLEAAADLVDGLESTDRPNLTDELAQTEAALLEVLCPDPEVPDGQAPRTHVEARLTLWRALLPKIEKIAADAEALPQRC